MASVQLLLQSPKLALRSYQDRELTWLDVLLMLSPYCTMHTPILQSYRHQLALWWLAGHHAVSSIIKANAKTNILQPHLIPFINLAQFRYITYTATIRLQLTVMHQIVNFNWLHMTCKGKLEKLYFTVLKLRTGISELWRVHGN